MRHHLRLVDRVPSDLIEEGTRVTWECAISEYVVSLRAAGRREQTIVQYRHYLRHLASHLERPWPVTSKDLERVLGAATWGPSARKSLRTAIAGFYRWATVHGHVDVDPSTCLPSVHVPPGRPRPIPDGVLAAAITAADTRTREMLLLAALAGLRAGEIARVHRDDLGDGMLLIHGKGGRERLVPIHRQELLDAITTAGGWLLPNRLGGHMTPNHVSKLMAAALPAPWTAHTLRHRFGTRAYAGTRDLLAVSALLGHASTETTRVYVLMPSDFLHAAVRAAGTIGGVAPVELVEWADAA